MAYVTTTPDEVSPTPSEPLEGGPVDDQSAYSAFLRLAQVVRREHTPGVDGWCTACVSPRQLSPCPPLRTTSNVFPFRMAELWTRPDVLAVLLARDIAGLFRLLQRRGISQRRIAECTQQSLILSRWPAAGL